MASSGTKLIFRPLLVVLGAVSAALSILLPLLQVVGWVNDNAVWSLWAIIVVLVITSMLLVARLAALKETTRIADAGVTLAEQRANSAEEEAKKARAALEKLQSVPQPVPAAGLSELDRSLAEELHGFASDAALLTMLADFFEYQIPREPVRLIDELARLPMTRAAHDPELAHHLSALAEAAQEWRANLSHAARIDGDYFTTKLDRWVSEAAYKRHDAMADELVRAGSDLHSRLLAYQRYYASL